MHLHKTCALIGSFLLLAITGCGDSVSDSKKLSELSTEEAKDVCLELVDDYPERSVTCGSTTITIGLKSSECTDQTQAPATCTATVGDVRDCNAALYSQTDAELCSDAPLPAACAKLAGC